VLQVTEETGIEIRATTPEQAVHDIPLPLRFIANDHDLCFRLRQIGRSYMQEHFSMMNKMDLLSNRYEVKS
jgi:hypothetical protein